MAAMPACARVEKRGEMNEGRTIDNVTPLINKLVQMRTVPRPDRVREHAQRRRLPEVPQGRRYGYCGWCEDRTVDAFHFSS